MQVADTWCSLATSNPGKSIAVAALQQLTMAVAALEEERTNPRRSCSPYSAAGADHHRSIL